MLARQQEFGTTINPQNNKREYNSNYTTGNILGQLPLWYLTNVHADDLPAQKAQIIIVISNCLQMFPNHFAVAYGYTNTEEKSLFFSAN